LGRLFGTDGVRGVAGRELDAVLAYDLGRAGAYVLSLGTKRPRILVGRDTRISGHMLEAALSSGICSVGADVLSVGVMPTPAVAWLTRKYGCDAGVVISASHNPMEDNGIKFFNGNGFKLPDAVEDRIEELIKEKVDELPRVCGADMGTIERVERAEDDYITFLKSLLDVSIRGMHVVLDCANGAAYHIAPRLFMELGAQVLAVYDTPDGTNINDSCGSTHMEHIQSIVRDTGADIGFAFDGDADRMLAVDSTGEIIDGDRIMAICAQDMKQRGLLSGNTLVVTVMSNLGLRVAMERCGIGIAVTSVGDRYVLERMLEQGYCIGGEQSGHVIFLADNTTGDGLVSAVRLISAVRRSGEPLSERKKVMDVYPQVLVNVTLSSNESKELLKADEVVNEEIRSIEQSYEGRGRVLVRASGTEPLIRVMVEGADGKKVRADADVLAKLIKERLG
jgi:phosphoglucosamine mutase